MSKHDDLGVDLRASDVYLTDVLAFLRDIHGAITDSERELTAAMSEAATLAWWDSET